MQVAIPYITANESWSQKIFSRVGLHNTCIFFMMLTVQVLASQSEQIACSSLVCFYTSLTITTCSLASQKKKQEVAKQVEPSTLLGMRCREQIPDADRACGSVVANPQITSFNDPGGGKHFLLWYVCMFRNISSHWRQSASCKRIVNTHSQETTQDDTQFPYEATRWLQQHTRVCKENEISNWDTVLSLTWEIEIRKSK